MKINNREGFTLIELLGVIVILSVIVMITVPIVQDKITESRKNAFLASVNGYVRASRIKNTEEGTTKFQIADENITPEVDYKGEVQGQGVIEYNSLGKVKVNVWNGTYCAVKAYENADVQLKSDIQDYTACMNA